MIASKIFLPGELHYIKVGLSDRQPLETMDACFFLPFVVRCLSRLFANFSILLVFISAGHTCTLFSFCFFLELYVKREDGLRLLLSLIPPKGCRFPCSHQSDWVRVVFSIHLFYDGKGKWVIGLGFLLYW